MFSKVKKKILEMLSIVSQLRDEEPYLPEVAPTTTSDRRTRSSNTATSKKLQRQQRQQNNNNAAALDELVYQSGNREEEQQQPKPNQFCSTTITEPNQQTFFDFPKISFQYSIRKGTHNENCRLPRRLRLLRHSRRRRNATRRSASRPATTAAAAGTTLEAGGGVGGARLGDGNDIAATGHVCIECNKGRR